VVYTYTTPDYGITYSSITRRDIVSKRVNIGYYRTYFHYQITMHTYSRFLPRDAMQARPMSSCGVTCVCLSRSCTTNKHVSSFFSPSGSQAILVFPYQTAWQYSDRNLATPTVPTGASNAGGMGRNRDSETISGFTACCQRCDRLGVINTAPLDRGKL